MFPYQNPAYISLLHHMCLMYPVTVKKIQDDDGDSHMWISVHEMAGVVVWDIATLHIGSLKSQYPK